MRKKLLLVVVCVALFLGAVGAYSYVVIAGFRSDVDSLQDTVSSLEEERNTLQNNVSALESQVEQLQNELSHMNCQKTFNFYWEGSIAEYFNTTRFWMNVTFERVFNENGTWIVIDGQEYLVGANKTQIVITVKVNDLRTTPQIWFEYVGIVSDITGSWQYLFSHYDNQTLAKREGGLGDYSGGQRFIDIIVLHLTHSTHEVQYDSELGFTFTIYSNYLEDLEVDNDRIHIEYAHKVAVEFCYGMELIA